NMLQIFDTTIRDGQQCPGAGMSLENNLAYAELAAEVGVDVLEAGFPAASETDFAIVQAIAHQMVNIPNGPIVAALCQLRDEQIEKTLAALAPLSPYGRARLHVYVPVDPNLMAASLCQYAKNKQRIIDDLHQFIKVAASK